MDAQAHAAAKRANDRVAIGLMVLLAVWAPVYFFGVRPLLNAWLAQYLRSYPIALHALPIFLPIVLLGWWLARRFPAPPPEWVPSALEDEPAGPPK